MAQSSLQVSDSGSTLSPKTSNPNPQTAHALGNETNLNEVTAPPPVYDPAEKPIQRQEYLENRRSIDGHDARVRLEEGRAEIRQSPQSERQISGVEEKPKATRLFPELSRIAYIISYLVVFSLAGTLLRLTIECLTFYPGTPVNTSVLWANVGGSIIMGFLSEDQGLFLFGEIEASIPESVRQDDTRRAAHLAAHKKTIPLYIGLTTGFCGSLTSFSTFVRDVFLALANDLPVPTGQYSDVSLFASAPVGARAPNGGFSFMALVAVIFTEIGLSLAGLFLGAHIAIGVSSRTPNLPRQLLRNVLDPAIAILAGLSWVTVICLVALLPADSKRSTLWSEGLWQGPVLFALVFSPVGCLARFFVSLKLNGRIASFPLGTFVVNVGGTVVLGMAYTLQHASLGVSNIGGGSVVGCQALQGVMDGFCGCLTTVSTWMLELSDLRRRHAYLYGGLSVAVALCALIVEIGSLKWTQGLVTPSCFAH